MDGLLLESLHFETSLPGSFVFIHIRQRWESNKTFWRQKYFAHKRRMCSAVRFIRDGVGYSCSRNIIHLGTRTYRVPNSIKSGDTFI
jgi:hypothetical protein